VPEPAADADRWLAILQGRRGRWGGELRRRQIFRRLAERTGGDIVESWSWEGIRRFVGGPRFDLPFLTPRRDGRRTKVVAGETLDPGVVRRLRRRADLVAVAVYDDPLLHNEALGFELPRPLARTLRHRRDANVDAFRWLVVPTASFAELAGLDMARVIPGENGTDVGRIVPGAWPVDPAIAFISGAAPDRGIETLIEAARLLHGEIPELRLLLWLMPTGEDSASYLDALAERVRRERWIEIDTVGGEDLSLALRQATLFCIPHPPHVYWDVALPVKIFDSLAAGRGLVVTPRHETVALVERHGVGRVAGGDTAEELADAMRPLLVDEREARRLGAAAREVAERVYDWPRVGDRIATAVLDREGLGERPA
jgi:glycosyltransferase involved in cell wall biosynthesis